MADAFVLVVWAVYLIDLFVAAPRGAWTFRGRRGAMRAAAGPDVELAGGFALARLPVLPWDAAFVAGGTDLSAAAASRVADVFSRTRPLTIAATALAAVLLLGLPAVRMAWVSPLQWVVVAVVWWAVTIVAFARAWRAVHGRRVPLETWIATLASPVGASRGACAVYWRSLESLHPVAAAAALCDDGELLRVARIWHHDAPAIRGSILALLDARGLAAGLAAPPADAEGLPQYCPRCGGGYATFAERCRDCQVPLVSAAGGIAAQRDQRVDA